MFPLFCLSVNHKNAGVEIRNKFSFSDDDSREFLLRIREKGIAAGGVVVSTCNRTEWYASGFLPGQETATQRLVEEEVAAQKHVDVSLLRTVCFAYFGEEAAGHLFRVAGGLDSMILGENQILGQVRESYFRDRNAGMTDFHANILFQRALTCAKRIKTETNLSRTSESAATLAVKEIMSIEPPRNVLLVGASGQIGGIVAKELSEREGVRVFATARDCKGSSGTQNPALANVETVPYEKRYDYIDCADAVISATKSPHYVFAFEETRDRIWTEKARLFIDLAVPADIDPDIARIQRCEIHTVDDFRKIAAEHNEQKKEGVRIAEEIIGEEIESAKKELLLHGEREFIEAHKDELSQKSGLQFLYELKKAADAETFASVLALCHKIVRKNGDGGTSR
ncbi:glutamyl-tRNA reductase [Treponema saccharophilum]|uniref:glutamyl-tRNA reductase n=1 Tax=Treponema saccharophilum TaxID=165 RepID=UPI00387000EB